MTQDAHTAHTLAGAYVLDALDELERRRFEAHLAECDICAQEIEGLQETATRLGVAAVQTPPPRLKERVMAEVGQVRQVPPRLDASGGTPRRWMPRLLALTAAASLVVAVVLGAAFVRTQDRLEQVRAAQQEMNAVLSAPDARALNAPVKTGGSGLVVYSRQRQKVVVAMTGLAALPADRRYELWLMGGGPPRPAGLMRASSPPAVVGVGGHTQVGITIEPAAGSPEPTTPAIFAAALP
ncbi:anti-sigma factor domain-containing protein [Spirillospora sp. NPDC050679]